MGIAGSDRFAAQVRRLTRHGRARHHESRRSPSTSTPASPAALCVRACREVQVNDVIGMADRGQAITIPCSTSHDPMGLSTCVDLRRVRAGLPDRRAVREEPDGQDGAKRAASDARQASSTRSARIAASAARPPSPSRTTASCRSTGRNGLANENRLCVKGRFGFDYVDIARAADQAADPPRRRAEVGDADHAIRRRSADASSAKRPGKRR